MPRATVARPPTGITGVGRRVGDGPRDRALHVHAVRRRRVERLLHAAGGVLVLRRAGDREPVLRDGVADDATGGRVERAGAIEPTAEWTGEAASKAAAVADEDPLNAADHYPAALHAAAPAAAEPDAARRNGGCCRPNEATGEIAVPDRDGREGTGQRAGRQRRLT